MAKGPSLAGHWPGEAKERQRVAYQRPLPGLSANGEYMTIIYVGTISLGGNLRLADGHSCDRNGRADGLLARRPRAPAAARSRTVRGPAPAAAAGATAGKGRTGRYGTAPARSTARNGPAGGSAAAPPPAGTRRAQPKRNAGRTGKPGAARPQLAK